MARRAAPAAVPARETGGAAARPSAAPAVARAAAEAARSAPLAPVLERARRDGPELVLALCAWFARSARDLPWRRSRDPYAIWVSEAMLQQTQVATVVPYFERFLARFPDVAALAAAPDDDLLAAWSGLGYYRRARALRAAAQAIGERHAGRLPREHAEWLALPGVGPYTAAAVTSIAFGASAALVDGNVARVLARLFALEAPAGSAEARAASWAVAGALVPPAGDGPAGPGAWNQALMELGATVCTPRAPACASCPLVAWCAARASGRERELPRPKAQRAAIDVALELAVVRRGDELLLVRRSGAAARLAGLYELPTREAGAAPRLFPSAWPAALEASGAALGELRHAITHHRIRARLVPAALVPPGLADGGDALETRWTRAPDAAALPLSGLARKALALLERTARAPLGR